MNVKEQAKNAVMTVKRKALPVAVSSVTALSAVSVNAFAAETGGGGGSFSGSSGLYSTIADSFGTGINEMMAGIGLVLTAIIPVAVGIVGVYAAIGAGKRIITKLAGG